MPIPIPVQMGNPPAGGGLLTQSRTLPAGWQRGISFLDTFCLSPVTLGECPSAEGLKPGQRPGSATFRPFSVVQAIECTAAGQLDLRGQAADQLDLTRDYAVARELLTGEASARDAGPASLGNPSLAGDAVDIGGTFATVTDLFGALEQYALGATYGRGAVILAPVAVAAKALAEGVIRPDGARLRTVMGSTVIASAAFDGRGPGTVAPPAEEAPLWAYSVPVLWAGVGERSIYQALDRAVNTDTARAEDIALVAFPTCAVFAGASLAVVRPKASEPPEPVPDLFTTFSGADGDPWPEPWVTSFMPAIGGSIEQTGTGWGRITTGDGHGNYSSLDATAVELFGPFEVADFDIRFTAVCGPGSNPGFVFRSDASLNSPHDGFVLNIFSDNSVRLVEITAWNYQTVGTSAGTLPTVTEQRVRVLAEGTRVRVKKWADGSPEPVGWDLDATVAITTPGRLGFCVGTNATPAPYWAQFRDIEAWWLP